MVSLSQLQDIPPENMILLVGPPGAGKSTFCEQTILKSLAMDRPVIYVTTEYGPPKAEVALKERGLAEIEPGLLNFVDAYSETVGLSVTERFDTVLADCANLSSLGIAISKLQERIGKRGILLVFDSLISPYLLSGQEVMRFLRLTLSRFVAEENSVLACMDEGSSKQEDLGAMMSIAGGVIRMEIKGNSRIISVVKHPKVAPTEIETPMTLSPAILYERIDLGVLRRLLEAAMGAQSGEPVRREVGDFVNLFWVNFTRWSGMLWDPKRLLRIAYDLGKQAHADGTRLMMSSSEFLPWHMRLLMKMSIPKNLSEVKDMKKFFTRFLGKFQKNWEYLEEASKKDEHYFRVYENPWCWGFDHVGARLDNCMQWVGLFKGAEKEERDWNMVETKCIGTGSQYCEFKLVPGEIAELKDSLEALDSAVLGNIHNRLMDQLIGFLIHGKPLPERPRLGSGVMIPSMAFAASLPAFFSERYRMALRMGGAKAGKEVGEQLMNIGIEEDEATSRIVNFIEYCKVGKIEVDSTIRIRENCESLLLEAGEPSCFFTTGFLNGFFSAVKNQHVKETKCIAMGNPYCEWEFR